MPFSVVWPALSKQKKCSVLRVLLSIDDDDGNDNERKAEGCPTHSFTRKNNRTAKEEVGQREESCSCARVNVGDSQFAPSSTADSITDCTAICQGGEKGELSPAVRQPLVGQHYSTLLSLLVRLAKALTAK